MSVTKSIPHVEQCKQDFSKNKMDICVHRCIDTVVSTLDPVPTIFKNVVSSMDIGDFEGTSKFPAYSKIKSTLYNRRNETLGVTKLKFKTISEVVVPKKFESFLLADYEDEVTRILVFCNQNAKTTICELREFFADGTFFICPKPFKQLFSIHGEMNSTVNKTNIIPLIFALMSDRKQSTYEILFHLIKSRITEWNPAKFTIDYERATMNALKKVFPDLAIHGCYFHYVKNIQKKADKLSLNKKPFTKRLVTLTTRLPLLPTELVQEGWLFVKNYASDDMTRFVKYFERTWLKNEEYVAVWNSFSERHRTTNSLEAFHAKMTKDIKVKHPNIAVLLQSLLKNINYVNKMSDQGNQKRLQIYIDRDEFIQDSQLRLLSGELSTGHFLDVVQNL